MNIVQLIQRARADADAYNDQTQALSLDALIQGSDDASGDGFAALGIRTPLHQAIYEYSFGSRLLTHIEARQELTDPLPRTLGDMITPKQTWFARSLAREAGLNADQECQLLFKYCLEEISKKAASRLIDHLKRKAAEMTTAPPDNDRDDWADSADNQPEGVPF